MENEMKPGKMNNCAAGKFCSLNLTSVFAVWEDFAQKN